jgi:hypothetical protein
MVPPRVEAPLRAIIVREDKDTLVVQANEADIQRFARARATEVDIHQATLRVGLVGGATYATTGQDFVLGGAASQANDPGVISMGDFLYDREGRRVAILDDVQVSFDRIDITTFGDMHANYMRGAMTVAIRAHGVPGVTVR